MVERHRQLVVRLPGVRVRIGLHLVRQQPREPAHALVQRPGQRPRQRGDLRPRRRHRRVVGADGAADPVRGIDLRRSVTAPGTAGSSTVHNGIQLDPVQFVPLDDPMKFSCSASRTDRAAPGDCRSRRTRNGRWGTHESAAAPSDRHRARPRHRGAAGAQPLEHRVRRPVAFLDLGGRQTAWTADRTEFLGRNGAPDAPAGAGPRTPPAGSCWRRSGPLRRAADQLRARQRRAHAESSSCSGRPTIATEAAELIRTGRDADHTATLRAVASYWDDTQGTIQVRTPDRVDGHHAQPLAASTRRSPAGCGRRAAFYQAGGAYGFRDQLQDVIALVTPKPRAGPRAPPAGCSTPICRR